MTVRFCRTCCYPDTKPDLIFDASGQCSACRSHDQRPSIDWDDRLSQLQQLLERHGNRVVVASSGGKDSTYIAMRMRELGVDVTAVTATTCHLTQLGRLNIDNLARHVRSIEITPNMTVRAKLNRIALETVGDVSWPEHASIFSVPFRVAHQLGATLIMYGENPQNQYGGPVGSDEALTMTRRWVSEFGGFNGMRPSDFIGLDGITERDMDDYRLPTAEELAGIEAHFLGQYEPWDSHRNARVASSAGMLYVRPLPSNWWQWENLDNAQTWIHDHLMYLKYGFSRGCSQISVDVRSGLIPRHEAFVWLGAHQPAMAPSMRYVTVTYGSMLDRIGVTDEWMQDICNRFTNKEIFGAGSPHYPGHVVPWTPVS